MRNNRRKRFWYSFWQFISKFKTSKKSLVLNNPFFSFDKILIHRILIHRLLLWNLYFSENNRIRNFINKTIGSSSYYLSWKDKEPLAFYRTFSITPKNSIGKDINPASKYVWLLNEGLILRTKTTCWNKLEQIFKKMGINSRFNILMDLLKDHKENYRKLVH